MNDQDIVYKMRLTGLKTIQDWHDEEGIGEPENEMLIGLTASIHSIMLLDPPEDELINCIKVTITSAFQLGRAQNITGYTGE